MGGALGSGGAIGKGGSSSGGAIGTGGGADRRRRRRGRLRGLDKSLFNVNMALMVTSTTPGVTCRSTSFTMHFEPMGSSVAVISGREGNVLTGDLVRNTQPITGYGVGDALSFPTRGDCQLNSVHVSELVLRAWDDDLDGIADWIEGAGRARGNLIQGDVGVSVELTFQLTGLPDEQRPSLIVPTGVHPLDGVRISGWSEGQTSSAPRLGHPRRSR